jgi:hypothetical protein
VPIADFESWRSELIQKGRIPSDDEAVDRDAAGRDCLRYVELVDMVRGTEGIVAFEALLESMQVEEDYEVYETTIGALQRFPGDIAGDRLFAGWRDLSHRCGSRAWDLLSLLAMGCFQPPAINAFNLAWARAPVEWRRELLALVLEQEQKGWLDSDKKRGVLRPSDSAVYAPSP